MKAQRVSDQFQFTWSNSWDLEIEKVSFLLKKMAKRALELKLTMWGAFNHKLQTPVSYFFVVDLCAAGGYKFGQSKMMQNKKLKNE